MARVAVRPDAYDEGLCQQIVIGRQHLPHAVGVVGVLVFHCTTIIPFTLLQDNAFRGDYLDSSTINNQRLESFLKLRAGLYPARPVPLCSRGGIATRRYSHETRRL